MSKADYLNQSLYIKQREKELSKELDDLEKKLAEVARWKEGKETEEKCRLVWEVCKKNTAKGFLHLLDLRLMKEKMHFTKDLSLQEARKSFSVAIRGWEKVISRQLKSFSEPRNETLLKLYSDEEVTQQFMYLNLGLDYLYHYLKGKNKWVWTILDLKESNLINLLNLLNLPKLLKEQNELLKDEYMKGQRIFSQLTVALEDCISGNWEKYTSQIRDNENPYEIRKAIRLLEIGRKLTGLLGEHQKQAQYNKKIKVWNNYMEKIAAKAKAREKANR